jgi:DNA-binding CsgD family transcriptional regulator
MTPQAREIIREVAERRGIDPGAITGPRRFQKLMLARVEIAHRLVARRYSLHRIGAILNRDHSTIFFYLGRSIKKPSKPKWRKPNVRDLCRLKSPKSPRPPKPVADYLTPYAGADMTEYVWRERAQ